jgi:predicted O-methyltransferase YrrM
MSTRSHLVFESDIQAALSQYIVDLFVHQSDAQAQITDTTSENGLPQIDLRPEEGWMLCLLTQMIGAKRAIEFGTLAGYSATWLAKGLGEDGHLLSLEYSEKHAKLARENLKAAGLQERVEVRIGDAHDIIDTLNEEFDLAFLDADKLGYDHYLTWALAHVRRGGLIVAHNAFQHADILKDAADTSESVVAMQQFNERIANEPRLTSTIIPIGDGLLVALVN